MTDVEALLRIRRFGAPVATTADIAAVLQTSVDNANKTLNRLARQGVARPVSRGVWAFVDDLDPKLVVHHLTAPWPSYVSLLTALRHHGMLSQIPQMIYVASLGRARVIETRGETYSIHTLAPEVFGGFEVMPSGAHVATPEKALFDVFYLSGSKGRTFASLPEVELTPRFDFKRVRDWARKIPSQRLRSIVEERTNKLEEMQD